MCRTSVWVSPWQLVDKVDEVDAGGSQARRGKKFALEAVALRKYINAYILRRKGAT